MKKLHFHFEDISPIGLPDNINLWLAQVISAEHFVVDNLNFIFCSDNYLLEINNTYLNHDYFTDIITFDLSEIEEQISGDLFISLDRVTENAQKFSCLFEKELLRVMVHVILHLCGYKDKSETDQKLIRSMEDFYLSLYDSMNVPRGTL